jgi:alpha-tubulin suppressor-like RCC1 family protein
MPGFQAYRWLRPWPETRRIGRSEHTVVWTEAGELFAFGCGFAGRLGHGGEEEEREPRLVGVLEGKKVVGAAAGDKHTVKWAEPGSLREALHLCDLWGWTALTGGCR